MRASRRFFISFAPRLPVQVRQNSSWSKAKKFWKAASVAPHQSGYAVQIDGRQVKTPTGMPVILPEAKQRLAEWVAAEWESIEVLKPYSLPLTTLVARALEDFAEPEARASAIANLVKFINTDAILYRQPYPDSLVTMQKKHWDPILDWASKKYGVKLHPVEGLLGTKQSAEAIEQLKSTCEHMDNFELAAFERAVIQTKSFLTALALMNRVISVEEATDAARVEVNHQISFWGEVEDTHDVDVEDVRRQLGSAVLAIM